MITRNVLHGYGNVVDAINKIRGINYEDNAEGHDIFLVENVRARFCHGGGINVRYFWCMIEILDINQLITQDCLSTLVSVVSFTDRVKAIEH